MSDSQNKVEKQQSINHEANAIINEILKKSKRNFHYSKALVKQAQYFSPFYRDFIAKVIANRSLKIVSGRDGYIEQIIKAGETVFSPKKPLILKADGEIKFDNKLSKKREQRIHADISILTALPHELGHSVDFMFGNANALSSVVILKNGKTLREVFTEEFESKHEELYKMVMEEYKNIINSNINDKAYDILINNMERYRLLCSIPISKNKKDQITRKLIQMDLYERGFVETYYLLFEKKCFQILNDKYSPILDALSSKYDFEGLYLHYHDKFYYDYSKYRPTYEFFANAFRAKVTGKYQHIEHLIRLLPKSFEAFEELFDICYQHIINNKRFTDVPIRQRSSMHDF